METERKKKTIIMPNGGENEVFYGPKSGWDKNHKKKIDDDQLIMALERCQGYVGDAAKAVGYSVTHMHRRINASEELQKAIKLIRERRIDWVENKFMKSIDEGSVTAQMFFLKTQAKKRGYEEKSNDDEKDKVIGALIDQIASLKAKYYGGESSDE